MKLMSGQALYMSEHIARQRIYNNTVGATFRPPYSGLDPCVNVVIGDKQTTEVMGLALFELDTVNAVYVAKRLAPGFYQFSNLPLEFQPLRIMTAAGEDVEYYDRIFWRKEDLAAYHYHEILKQSRIVITKYYTPPYDQYFFACNARAGNFSRSGSTYKCFGTVPDYGLWSVSYKVTMLSPDIPFYTIEVDQPPGTRLQWTPGSTFPPFALVTYKLFNGEKWAVVYSPYVTIQNYPTI